MPETDERERLWSLVKDIRYAMFTTRHDDGQLHSRPMTVQNGRFEDDDLWFFMSRRNGPVRDIERDRVVHVAFADPDGDRYVSISGEAQVVDDTVRARAMWSKMAEAWFPGGPEDPDLALVKVAITHAEYWLVKESKPVQLFKMLRSAATGKPPKDLGEHSEVKMG